MVIFKPMVLVGIFLIVIGIYGVSGYVHRPTLDDCIFYPRKTLLDPVLHKIGQDLGHTGATAVLVIGGIMVVVGAVGWFRSRNEPDDVA